MELDLRIQNLGKIEDIFDFYKFLNSQGEFKNIALLESIEDNQSINPSMMFSFIGINPDFMVKIIQDQLTFYDINSEKGDKIRQYCESHEIDNTINQLAFEDSVPIVYPALDMLKTLFPVSKVAMPELFPRKIFSGGLLGYIGYDVVAPYVGYTPQNSAYELFPDICMGLFTNVLAYSHTTKSLYHIENTIDNSQPDSDFHPYLEKYINHKTKKKKSSKKMKSEISIQSEDNIIDFKCNTSDSKWENMINAAKEHIFAGDIIQGVLSRRLYSDLKPSPLEVYEALRVYNPSPYMYCLQFKNAHNGDINILGSSPEALISKNQTYLNTVPIAGTRRRGKSPEDDDRLAKELMADEKELAEHIMLVDLARNDLARISIPGTIDTYELIQLRKYQSVMHLVSRVRSQSLMDPFTILKSMFPAGTVSGAPKKRAMEIIHQLEQEDRGPYAGCAGYISFTGDMDMAISIRTIYNKNQRFYLQAGAGIVADSKPEFELLETNNKMRSLITAINTVEANKSIKRKLEEKTC